MLDIKQFRRLAVCGGKDALKDSVGIAIAGGMFSFVFGVLALHHGFRFIEAFVMNTGVYAGALQMISIPFWNQHPLPTLSLVSLAFMVCMRYVLMGMVMQSKLNGLTGWKIYIALFFVADENWALTVIKSKTHTNEAYLYGYFLVSGLFFYFFWVLFGWMGMVLAPLIKHPETFGLDFAFLAVFFAMLVALWRGKNDWLPIVVAAIAALSVETVLPGAWHIIAGALCGSLFGAWRDCHAD
jgi:predicted branched-subunit amino acid permease